MTRVFINPMIGRHGIRKIFGEFPYNFEYPVKNYPSVDIMEDETTVKLFVELPGIKKEDINIKLENGILTLRGEKKNYQIENDKISIIKTERRFGKFERKVYLPEGINPDEVNAKFDNGLLEIYISKLIPVKPKERVIEVK